MARAALLCYARSVRSLYDVPPVILLQPSALLPLLPPQSRLLGLDAGEKTIGVALSDSLRTIATPLLTLSRTKFLKDAEKLKALTDKHEVGALVLGFPLNMDGTTGPRAQSVRTLAGSLQRHIALPLLLWDERMSTMAAERVIQEASLSRGKRDAVVDKLAAAYILQGALDALNALT